MLDNINYFKWAKFLNIFSRNINYFKVSAPTTTRTTEYFLVIFSYIDRWIEEGMSAQSWRCPNVLVTHVTLMWVIFYVTTNIGSSLFALCYYCYSIGKLSWITARSAFQNVKEAFHMQWNVLSSHLSQLLNDLLICRYPECSLWYFVQ